MRDSFLHEHRNLSSRNGILGRTYDSTKSKDRREVYSTSLNSDRFISIREIFLFFFVLLPKTINIPNLVPMIVQYHWYTRSERIFKCLKTVSVIKR